MSIPTTSPGFIDSMLDEFAQFIVAAHKKYIDTKRIQGDHESEKMDICENSQTSTNFRTFLLYELYKIGVFRKIITGTDVEPKLVLLYVRRNSPNGNSDNLIVKLCRSLYFDMENMLIVSCGDFKCLSLAEFSRITSGKISHIFLKADGCQIIYNPGLQSTYGADTLEPKNDDGDHTEQQIPQKVKDFTVATRTIIDANTTKFNPTSGTFGEIFRLACKNRKIDLSMLSDIYKKNHSLVFNLLTSDTVIVKFPNITESIRLCRAYKHLSINDMIESWLSVKHLMEDTHASNDDYNRFYDIIKYQISNGIKEINLMDAVIDCGLKNIELSVPYINTENIPITDIYESMQTVINTYYYSKSSSFIPCNCVALFLIGENGEKTKIMVPEYQYYYELRGDKSIDITPENSYNLFHTYWRLIKTSKLDEFLAIFDNPINHKISPITGQYCTYTQIFDWFKSLIDKFVGSIFNSYRQVYIYKNKTIGDVPFSERPIVSEIYDDYKAKRTSGVDKVFTSVHTVREIVMRHDSEFIIWRLSPAHVKVVEERFMNATLQTQSHSS